MGEELGFLLDVDDTLLDNDALKNDMSSRLRAALGDAGVALFWQDYEVVRAEQDVVDLPHTASHYAARVGDPTTQAAILAALDAIPFAQFLYPTALATIAYLKSLGMVTILSDGDQVFQHNKVERSGLGGAVDQRVLIYKHKQDHLAEVQQRQPVAHQVLIDDKAQVLAAVKELWGEHVTTVHVRQGHYASLPLPAGFVPDLVVDSIGDVRQIARETFISAAQVTQ